MINSILVNIGRIYKKVLTKAQELCGGMQDFTKIANMTNPKLRNNQAAFSHAVKNIWKNDKKPGYI